MTTRRTLPLICAIVAVLAAGLHALQLSPATPLQTRITEVERLISEGEWDRASELLTEVITELAPGERNQETNRLLVLAYERRAMARLQMGDEPSARLDFATLLQLEPNHAIASASPGVAGLFADVRKSTLGLLDLAVRPVDATLTLEGGGDPASSGDAAPRAIAGGSRWLRPGIYRVTVRRPGHEPVTHAFTAAAGSTERRVIALPRTSVALFVSTTPGGVRVLIDGDLRGVTEAAPGSAASSVLVIDGLVPRDTPYKVRFEKECFVPAADTFLVESLDAPVGTDGPDPHRVRLDRTYDPVLKPAFGTLQVLADQPDASIWIDGQRRGAATTPVTDVCEGIHDVDVRAPAGRFATKVTIDYAKTIRVPAPLVPTFALIPSAAQGAPLDESATVRLIDAFRASSAIRLLTPDSGELEALKSSDAAAIAQRLDVQGVATAVRIPADAEGRDVELSLTTAGAARADVVRLRLDDAGSIERLMKRLDATLPVSSPSIGVDVVDVLRVENAVVSAVDPVGPANGLIKPGDVIVGIGPEPVATAQDLKTVLAAAGGPTVSVRIRGRTDAVSVNVVQRPVVVNMKEPGLVFNETVPELRARLARLRADGHTPDHAEADRLQLNLVAALIAIDGWTDAETLLKDLAPGPENGIAIGTLEYLRGLVYNGLGRRSDARVHFERAAQDARAMLTEHGPLVAYLAKSELRPR